MNDPIIQKRIIQLTADYIREHSSGDNTGHDWWHVHRVWQMAKKIGLEEKADLFIVELSALLHDIGDWKFHDGDDSIGPEKAAEWLDRFDLYNEVKESVCRIVRDISFHRTFKEQRPLSIEGKVVQDADRLDAMGAIGIARVFAYGGSHNRVIYDPDISPVLPESAELYLKNQNPSINHFYEKLFLLKDMMNTAYGKKIAEKRHQYMKQYLDRFYKEWAGEQ